MEAQGRDRSLKMETGWVTLTEHPKKLRSVQMAAVTPSAGQQLVKIGQDEVSDSYIWVMERAGWQPFNPHESAAATRKQQLKWKFLEEAERSVMWLQVSASHRRYPFPYSCCSVDKSSILGRLSGVEIDFYGRGGNNIADAKGCAWLKEWKKKGYSWMISKKTEMIRTDKSLLHYIYTRWSPRNSKSFQSQINCSRSIFCLRLKADMGHSQTGVGPLSRNREGRKSPGPNRLSITLVLKTWVYVDGCCPGNSAAHLTVSYWRHLAALAIWLN